MNWAFHGTPILSRWAEFMTYETIFGRKMSYFSPFLLPKDHLKEKCHHYFYHFFITHEPSAFLVKFIKFLPYVTQINPENIKTLNLLRRMHYSGPDSPALSQLNKLEAQGPCTGHRSIIAILYCFSFKERGGGQNFSTSFCMRFSQVPLCRRRFKVIFDDIIFLLSGNIIE